MGWSRTRRRAGIATAGAVATLVLAACGTSISSGARSGATSPLPPQRELLPDQQVQQVLDRFAFGGRPGDAARVRAMGVDRWVALQLQPERIDDSATDRLLASYDTLDEPTPAIAQSYREVQSYREMQSAKLARAVMSERQLLEVMVDFWENHFSVFAGKGQTRLFLAAYDRDAIRPNALGKFRDLLGAVAKSPAMLIYLDNWRSSADSDRPTLAANGTRIRAPAATALRPGTPPRPRRMRGVNENYGRELMELHTLGVDGGYTQKDVIEVARAFTGWTMDPRDGSFVFRPQMHDAGAKVVLGHRLPAGRGIEDGEEVLDILASSPATAHFIARKLVVHFVSDSAPPALVERVAQTYLRTGGDIREMMRTIATSPELFSRAAYRAKVKTPFELVASALRAMGAAPDTSYRSAAAVGRLGQPIFGRQTPDGWPDHGDAWMNTGAILNRINFGLALANGRIPGASLATWPYTDSLAALDRERQVDGVIATILGGEASPVTRRVLISGENPMLSKYADSVDARPSFDYDRATPNGAKRGATGAAALRQILGLALGAPEFQRR